MADITVLWAGAKWRQLVPYEKEKHAQLVFKFLYWGEGISGTPIIIAGESIYAHKDLAFIAKNKGVVAGQQPNGAGICWDKGVVQRWSSQILKVTTPEELRPIILEALGLR